MARLMVPGRGFTGQNLLSLRVPDDKSSGPPQQYLSSIIGGKLTVISLINMLLVKVDNSIFFFI